MTLVFWPLTFKISEVDEPCACEYASASQCFQPLAGEEIYGRISETEFWKTWLVCDHVSLNCYFLIQQFVAIEIYRRRGLTVFCRDLNITADLQSEIKRCQFRGDPDCSRCICVGGPANGREYEREE